MGCDVLGTSVVQIIFDASRDVDDNVEDEEADPGNLKLLDHVDFRVEPFIFL